MGTKDTKLVTQEQREQRVQELLDDILKLKHEKKWAIYSIIVDIALFVVVMFVVKCTAVVLNNHFSYFWGVILFIFNILIFGHRIFCSISDLNHINKVILGLERRIALKMSLKRKRGNAKKNSTHI